MSSTHLRRHGKRHASFFGFSFWYGAALFAAAAALLLDTFVIPKAMGSAAPSGSAVSPTSAAGETAQSNGSLSAGDAVAITESSYTDGNISITLSTLRAYSTDYYLADVTLSDVSLLQTALAQNTYGRNIKQTTSSMAEEHGAILAINGDYYGFRDTGYVARNGILYRDAADEGDALAILSDGSFSIAAESEASASSLMDAGAWQIFSFGPALLENGEITVSENEEVDQAKTSNPRTAIGMISPLHYLILVSDGRTDKSTGLTLFQLAGLMAEAGCVTAYNLDGGGSSTLWFNGAVVNNPAGGRSGSQEREVSDIVYIGY